MSATLYTVSSGSIGNNYILTAGGETLLIELGVPFKETLKALNFDLSGVVGCCVSHIHGDHSKGIKDALAYGLQVYAPREVCDKYPKCHRVNNLKRYGIGGFVVMPLRVPHGDCEECFAYHITLPDGQTLLFCTDAQTLPYRLPNINILMIEANFSEELIIDRLCEGEDIRSHYNAHMELNETIKVIKRLNNPNLNKVILIHLSANNSDEQMFKDRVFSETGVKCEIANARSTYELKEDF